MQDFDLTVKKRPIQARSKATFDALIEACTLVLPKLGYAGTTTNHIAEVAGVGISSLYEYFPNKDSIVAEAIKKWNNKLIYQLAQAALSISDKNYPIEKLMLAWLNSIYECLEKDTDLIRVFTYEVPYSDYVSEQEGLAHQLFMFSESLEFRAEEFLPRKQSKESMYLIVTLVVTTLTNLVINPPNELNKQAVLNELASRLNQWIF